MFYLINSVKIVGYIYQVEVMTLNLQLKRIETKDYEDVSKMICRNFLEINIRDYSQREMTELCSLHRPDDIKKLSQQGPMYIAILDHQIVGCGAMHYSKKSSSEGTLKTIFVLPEFHGQGIGQRILKQLEQVAIQLGVQRLLANASITAYDFYLRNGYQPLHGIKRLNEYQCYTIEKTLTSPHLKGDQPHETKVSKSDT